MRGSIRLSINPGAPAPIAFTSGLTLETAEEDFSVWPYMVSVIKYIFLLSFDHNRFEQYDSEHGFAERLEAETAASCGNRNIPQPDKPTERIIRKKYIFLIKSNIIGANPTSMADGKSVSYRAF